jgi:virulence-associated protein VagC
MSAAALAIPAPAAFAQSQVFIVQSEHQQNLPPFQPTHVKLDQRKLTSRSRRELIMAFTAEQGFARRPLPLDSHGLLLHANGDLKPDGLDYEQMLQKKGISSKPGDRLVISDIKIESDKIVFLFNGGPDRKHKFLRHIEIGAGMGTAPVVQDDGQEPVGSRLTLNFDKYVPDMTPDQLRALIQPVMDFSVKTPMEAYADTLPPRLKEAILHHEVLVGMNRKMVIYALGQPHGKTREEDNGVPIEIWIYGEAPQTTQFVRFNGDKVVRVEIANVGQDLIVRNHDETGGYQDTSNVHEVKMGDAQPSPDGESAKRKAPPTLRLPGEQLPGPMQPVSQPGQPDNKPQPIPPPPGSSPGADGHWSTAQSTAGHWPN